MFHEWGQIKSSALTFKVDFIQSKILTNDGPNFPLQEELNKLNPDFDTLT